MKKPYSFTELSDVRCGNPNCRKPLKKNIVERKIKNRLLVCWECWVMKTRKLTLAAYKKYRNARAEAKAKGDDPKMIKA